VLSEIARRAGQSDSLTELWIKYVRDRRK